MLNRAMQGTAFASNFAAGFCFRIHLRDRFTLGGIGCRGRNFAIGPDGAIGEEFLFPDGHRAFQSVDGVAAGVESGGTMRRAHCDEDRSFADFDAPEAVDDGYAMDREFFAHLGANFADFR